MDKNKKQELMDHINGLKLHAPLNLVATEPNSPSKENPLPEKPPQPASGRTPSSGAKLINNAIVFFADSSLSEELKNDVQHSLLFSQLAANHALKNSHETNDDETSQLIWFDEVKGVLGKIGWIQEGVDRGEVQYEVESLDLSKLVLDVLKGLGGISVGNLSSWKRVLAGVETLAQNVKQLNIFGKVQKEYGDAHTELGTVDFKDDTVHLLLTNVAMKGKAKDNNFLIFEFSSDTKTTYHETLRLRFDETVYAIGRDLIFTRISGYVKSSIQDIQI